MGCEEDKIKVRGMEDLEAAANAAGDARPGDHAMRAARVSAQLSSHYDRTGNLHHLEAAIARSEEAVESIPEGHPNRAVYLSNFGRQLSRRHERTGNLQDLEAAIARSEEAVKSTPQDHPDRVGLLNNLGCHLSSRHERTGNLQDLEAAITISEEVVEATPENHPETAKLLNNLGHRLSSRYGRTGNLQDLEAAITISEELIEATPEDHPNRATLLHQLGHELSSRYERTGNLQDLEAAIARSDEAVGSTLTPQDHPDRASWLHKLGCYLSSRYDRTGNLQGLEAALATWVASWNMISAPVMIRIRAVLLAAKLLVFNPLVKDVSRACSLLRDAVHLMPMATPRSLEREDQQHILGQLSGLASLSASVSLEAGEPPLEALRLQELGRTVTNGQLLDYQSDISDLMQHHPTLGQAFDSLRQELDSPFPPSVSICSPFPSPGSNMTINVARLSPNERLQAQQFAIRRRNTVAQDLDNILVQIRQKPGFENFLRAESEPYLFSAAQAGPIVVLNVTQLRSDAIILMNAKVGSIPLPHLSYASMIKYYITSAATLDNTLHRKFLEWLWKAAVQPVLQELGFYPDKVDPLPRIWWIGVGLMAKAPIHAAGKFTRSSVPSILPSIIYI